MDAKLCIVGESATEMDARFSTPFFPEVGSGRMVTDWIQRAGWQRSQTLLTSLVWCQPVRSIVNGVPQGSRQPTKAEIAFCTKRHLIPLLKQAKLTEPSDRVLAFLDGQIPKPKKGKQTSLVGEFFLEMDNVNKHIGTFHQRDLRVGELARQQSVEPPSEPAEFGSGISGDGVGGSDPQNKLSAERDAGAIAGTEAGGSGTQSGPAQLAFDV